MTAGELFARPEALVGLALVPFVWGALTWLDRKRTQRLEHLIGPRIHGLAEERSESRRAIRRALFSIAFMFAVLAAAGPLYGHSERDTEWQGVDVVIALDVSRSMLAEDVSPSRLAHAKAEIRALADRAVGDRLGLVAFAGTARLVVPLTADRASFATLVDLVDPYAVDKGGTDLGAALETSLDALAWREGAAGAVFLLTDGEDLSGRGERVARRCRDRGIVVHTVGLGTERGAKIALPVEGGEVFLRDRSGTEVVSALDRSGLARIASVTGGTTLVSNADADSLVSIYEDENLPLARTAVASGERRPEDRFQWPLALALLLWLVELAMSDCACVRPRPSLFARAAAPAALGAALLFVLAGCDATTDGRAAWDDGDPDTALERFDEAVATAGDGASAALLYDQAVAALAVGEYEKAEAAARAAAERGGDAYAGLDAFVRGSAAFARSQVAFVQAQAKLDDPRALMPALRFAEDALAGWQWAAASRPDWPEARRNAERGLLWLLDLREMRAGEGKRQPPPPEKPQPDEEEPEPPPLPELETKDLPAARVLDLLELLQAKEQKKILERRARRHVRGGNVEKDW